MQCIHLHVLALCKAVAGGWSSVALSEWSPYPSCFECECVRDKEKWSPYPSGRHIRVVTISEWSPYPSGRHIRVVAISEWSPYPSGRHIRVVTISEWSPYPSGHHIRVVTISEWSPYPSGHHIRVVTMSEWSPCPSGHHVRVVTISEWSPYPSGHHIRVVTITGFTVCELKPIQLVYTIFLAVPFLKPHVVLLVLAWPLQRSRCLQHYSSPRCVLGPLATLTHHHHSEDNSMLVHDCCIDIGRPSRKCMFDCLWVCVVRYAAVMPVNFFKYLEMVLL